MQKQQEVRENPQNKKPLRVVKETSFGSVGVVESGNSGGSPFLDMQGLL
jgi:hypothetical protein